MFAAAETPTGTDDAATSPVAQVRKNQSWEYGPFLNWGTGVGDRSNYKFFWGGFQLGKVLTSPIHAGIFSGQFELAGNIMPLWQAYTPAPMSRRSSTRAAPVLPARRALTRRLKGAGPITA